MASMVSYENRQKLKEKLPLSASNGFDLIEKELPGLTRKQIERAFNTKTAVGYREDVLIAALKVIKDAEVSTEKLTKEIESI